jgi:hypothetical protein
MPQQERNYTNFKVGVPPGQRPMGRQVTLTLFYTCGLEIVVSHVMVLQPYRFSLCLPRYGNLTILKFSFKWVKVMLPYTGGGGLPVVGGGGSLMTHGAGSVTTQSIALKHVRASEPYRYTLYLKQVMAGLPHIKIYFF